MSLRQLGLNVFLKQNGHFGSGQNAFTFQQEHDVLVFKPGFGQGPAIARARRPIKSVVLRFQGMKQCSMLSVIIGEGSALIPSEVSDSASREQHVVLSLAEQKSLQGLVGMHWRDQPVFLTAILHGGSGIFLPHDQVCQTGYGRLTECLHPSRLEACQSWLSLAIAALTSFVPAPWQISVFSVLGGQKWALQRFQLHLEAPILHHADANVSNLNINFMQGSEPRSWLQ